ncbi:MAG: thymidine phosphorylase [Rhodothermales bacterium]
MTFNSRKTFNPIDLIARKRDGKDLPAQAIHALVDAYTTGDLPDYQMSAFLMAAFLNGLNAEETSALTHAMLYSGEVLDLSSIPGIKVDKHSTGGVGDKVSLLLAPIVAACGVPVPMISGRGLGHSGGTLDKLESIPGFQVNLDAATYKAQLADIGVVMIGQTTEIAPADRKIYALRDVTATIENISFIAPSIMSKKIAAGVDALVLDVKCGTGAFMKTTEEARKLAELLVAIGEKFGKPTVAWMTSMDEPLGYAAGNWPEMYESIRCLQGAWIPDLMEVTLTLAGEMLWLGNVAKDPQEGYLKAKEVVDNGKALDKLIELVHAQGGDTRVIENPDSYPAANHVVEIRALEHERGFVTSINALEIGKITVALGAGRLKKEDVVDPAAGVVLGLKVGDPVNKGDVLATLHAGTAFDLPGFEKRIRSAMQFGAEAPDKTSMLMDRYTKAGWQGAN